MCLTDLSKTNGFLDRQRTGLGSCKSIVWSLQTLQDLWAELVIKGRVEDTMDIQPSKQELVSAATLKEIGPS